MTSSLTTLADRVQALTSACRETDILIGYAIDLDADSKFLSFRKSFDTCGMEQMLRMAESHQNTWRDALPRYTASLDCAMTLVPEDMEWEVGTAKLMDIGWARVVAVHDQWKSKASTPVLALTAASLRARAALENSHG